MVPFPCQLKEPTLRFAGYDGAAVNLSEYHGRLHMLRGKPPEGRRLPRKHAQRFKA